MKAPQCPRWPAVEQASIASPDALPDGELRDHLTQCPRCQQQLGSDSAILQALRGSPPPVWKPEGREAVRAALTPEQVTAMRRRQRNRRLLAGGLGAAGLVALVAWLRLSTDAPPATRFELAAAPGTEFETLASGAETWLRLGDGSLAVHVDHLLPSQQFAIDLPDGRLAVRGTRFTVRVKRGATQEVAVSEGRVELWLPGEHRLVEAGERWHAAEPSRSLPPASAPTSLQVAPARPAIEPPAAAAPQREASARTAASAPAAEANATSAPAPIIEEPASAAATMKKRPASTGFPEAVKVFRDGDYAGAERALAAFIEAHPADRRSEDALFLRIRSLQYLGRDEEARQQSMHYLSRYPQGLRRPEVEQVLAP